MSMFRNCCHRHFDLWSLSLLKARAIWTLQYTKLIKKHEIKKIGKYYTHTFIYILQSTIRLRANTDCIDKWYSSIQYNVQLTFLELNTMYAMNVKLISTLKFRSDFTSSTELKINFIHNNYLHTKVFLFHHH